MAMIDLSQPAEAILLYRINALYNRNYTFADVYFDPQGPRVVDYKGCDTLLQVFPRPGSRYQGILRVYYNRINLTEYLAGQSLQVPIAEVNNTDDVRRFMLLQFGINLGRNDIVYDPIDKTKNQFTLQISTKSVLYKGGVTVQLLRDEQQTLMSQISQVELNGFFVEQYEEPVA